MRSWEWGEGAEQVSLGLGFLSRSLRVTLLLHGLFLSVFDLLFFRLFIPSLQESEEKKKKNRRASPAAWTF